MTEVRLVYKREDYLNDVQEIPRAFAPYLIINENSEHYLKWEYEYKNPIFDLTISSDLWKEKTYNFHILNDDFNEYKRETKRGIKGALYDFLTEVLQISLPFGSLTGVRPTKLYYELLKKSEYPEKELVEKYHVSPNKSELIAQCVKNQKNYINNDKKNIGLFVNIPFCPSRCKYCSFISTEIFRVKKQLDFYIECLEKELKTIFEIISKKGYNVRSIYVGGGTPPSIGTERLSRLLCLLSEFGTEFTVEAGRPDAIDEKTVNVLKNANVTRVSVNPQTFSDNTLQLIGRSHTVDDFYNAYSLVREKGFIINSDLIAGLPGENFNVFSDSLKKCIELSPDNITVHSLSLKRGSVFTVSGMEKNEYGTVSEMIDYAHSELKNAGYVPYYMYRQKNTADNLENTGYCLPGKQCIYNIDMMEEASTILGAGAGAMSKLVCGGKITRLSVPKGFREYCERLDETLEKKKLFFDI